MTQATVVGSIVFNPNAEHQVICGEPGVAYKQGSAYFNQAGKPAVLEPCDQRTAAQKEVDAIRAENDALKQELSAVQLQLASEQLKNKPSESVIPQPVSEPIVVDSAEPVESVARKTLSLKTFSAKAQ